MFRMPVAFVSQNGRSGKKDSANRSHARNHDNDAPQNLIRYPQPSLARSGTCGHRATDSPTAAFLNAEISTLADEMPRRLLLSTNPETSARFRYPILPISSAVFLHGSYPAASSLLLWKWRWRCTGRRRSGRPAGGSHQLRIVLQDLNKTAGHIQGCRHKGLVGV